MLTEEEKRIKNREACRKWRDKHKDERSEYNRQYYAKNKESIAEQKRQYYAKNKESIAEYYRQYRAENKDAISEHMRQYYIDNKEHIRQYKKTPIGRASYLLTAYNQMDKEKCFEHGDLTAEWIVENIFTKPCAHCGVSGWDIIGCNRLDNSKPHTRDNVEPCCMPCNSSLGTTERWEKYRAERN